MRGGGGGNVYWGRKETQRVRGIVVAFSWGSIEERHLRSYVDLYSSLDWNSLLCHADFLSPLFSEKATSLAINVLNELVEELRIRQRPVVFVAFSGAPKASMYKVFQIIQGTCEAQLNLNDNRLVKNCISGQIYDSGPVDFTSDMSARFAMHPTLLKMPGSLKLASGVARVVTSGLDALFLTKFECQRAEYWDTLYSSAQLGTPFLIVCSKNDDLAPCHVILKFAQRLQDIGAQVQLIKWNSSPHVGHYKQHPSQYRTSVNDLLEKATAIYHQRRQQLSNDLDGTNDEISELICNLQNAAVSSNQSLRRVALGPSDHFYLPSSSASQNQTSFGSGSVEDEPKERMIQSTRPGINAHGVLGQALFDACVPKNVDGWDVKFSGSATRRRSPLHAFKCIRRSRL